MWHLDYDVDSERTSGILTDVKMNFINYFRSTKQKYIFCDCKAFAPFSPLTIL